MRMRALCLAVVLSGRLVLAADDAPVVIELMPKAPVSVAPQLRETKSEPKREWIMWAALGVLSAAVTASLVGVVVAGATNREVASSERPFAPGEVCQGPCAGSVGFSR